MRRGGAREAVAHLPHPAGGGLTLCGDAPTRIRGCGACQDRLVLLRRVHVQSPRKPSEGMCGIRLSEPSFLDQASTHTPPRISPAYVTAPQARALVADPSGVEVCPGCASNLSRYDEAARRRARRMAGEDLDPAPGLAPVAAPALPQLAGDALHDDVEDDVY